MVPSNANFFEVQVDTDSHPRNAKNPYLGLIKRDKYVSSGDVDTRRKTYPFNTYPTSYPLLTARTILLSSPTELDPEPVSRALK